MGIRRNLLQPQQSDFEAPSKLMASWGWEGQETVARAWNFEDGTTGGWAGYGSTAPTVTTEQARSGTQSLRMQVAAGQNSSITSISLSDYIDFPSLAGQLFRFNCWTRPGGVARQVRTVLYTYGPGGMVDNIPGPFVDQIAGQWVQVVNSGQISPGVLTATLLIQVNPVNTDGSDVHYIDDVTFNAPAIATPNAQGTYVGWNAAAGTVADVTTDQAHTGSRSLAIMPQVATPVSWTLDQGHGFNRQPIDPSQQYRFTAWVRPPSSQKWDMEDGTITGWSSPNSPSTTVANTTDQAHTGNRSLLVTYGGGVGWGPGTEGALRTVRVTAGAQYRFSGWVRATQPGRNIRIMGFFDSATGDMGYPLAPAPANTWTYLETTVTAPANAVSLNFMVGLDNAVSGETFYVDDVTVSRVITAALAVYWYAADNATLLGAWGMPGGNVTLAPDTWTQLQGNIGIDPTALPAGAFARLQVAFNQTVSGDTVYVDDITWEAVWANNGVGGGLVGGWNPQLGSVANTNWTAHSGERSLALSVATAGAGTTWQDVWVPEGSAGLAVTLTAWVLYWSPAGGTRQVCGSLQTLTGVGGGTAGVNRVEGDVVTLTPSQWTQITTEFVIAPDTVIMRIGSLMVKDAQVGDTFWTDDISLEADWPETGLRQDPQGNWWTVTGSQQGAPYGWNGDGGYRFDGTGYTGMMGPMCLGPPIRDGGIDLRIRWQVAPGATTWPFTVRPPTPLPPGSAWPGPWTVAITVNTAGNIYLALWDIAGTLFYYAIVNLGTAANNVNWAVGDWLTLRFTYDNVAGTSTVYQQDDDGTWRQVVTRTDAVINLRGNPGDIVSSPMAFNSALAWVDVRTFDGTPLASVDLTYPWGTTGFVRMTPTTGPAWVSTQVRITGWGLDRVTGVSFDGYPGRIVSVTDLGLGQGWEMIVATPIFGDNVTRDVILHTPEGDMHVASFTWTAVAPAPPEPPGPGGVPMHQGRCLALAYVTVNPLAALADQLTVANLLDLMDYDANGLIIDTVDLGFPDIREDMAVIPDADGEWDFTRFFGARGISLSGTLVDSSRGTRMMALRALGPFLSVPARPSLIYSFNTDDDIAYMRLRVAGYSGAITNPVITKFQVQYKATQPPVGYSLTTQSVRVIPGSLYAFGRIYTEPQPQDPGGPGVITATSGWEPDRHYPDMGGAQHALAVNAGDASTWPFILITGYCVGPAVYNDTTGLGFAMAPSFVLNSGETLVVDMRDRQVYLGTPDASRYAQVNFASSAWWSLQPGENDVRFTPNTAGDDASATVVWQNAYLT